MPAGKWCFERGPETHIFVMDWVNLHHQVSNLCSSQAIYEGKQLPPMALWKLKSTSSVSLPGIKYVEIPGQTSHMDYFSRRAQDWGSAQNESVNYRNWAKITKLLLFSTGLSSYPLQWSQTTSIRKGKKKQSHFLHQIVNSAHFDRSDESNWTSPHFFLSPCLPALLPPHFPIYFFISFPLQFISCPLILALLCCPFSVPCLSPIAYFLLLAFFPVCDNI